MSSKKKTVKPEIIEETQEIIAEEVTPVAEVTPVVEEVVEKPKKETKKTEEKQPKHKIGSIVFVARNAEADLNGFKLFPQYKKYTYTVEAYDADTGVYTLRRLNLSLKLKEAFILAPDEKAHDPLNRKQF